MTRITQSTRLEQVEHVLGSKTNVLDFAVEGENDYYTWDGREDADWTIEDVDYVENVEEDRYILYPEGEYFTCDIEASREEGNQGPVRCWCEELRDS